MNSSHEIEHHDAGMPSAESGNFRDLGSPSHIPVFSIVIPTFRRLDQLLMTLAAIEDQTFPKEHFEVIVSDDGSGDGTVEHLNAYAERSALRIAVLTGPNGGPAAARNRGIATAKGEWVVFTDDDCVPDPEWLDGFMKAIGADVGLSGAGGFVERYQDTLLGRYIDWSRMMLPPVKADGTASYLVTANALYRRQLLVEIGGFDLAFKAPGGEDPHLSFRALERGAKLVYLPSVKVRHIHRDTVKGIYRTWFHYGVGERVLDELRGMNNDRRFLYLVRKDMGAVRRLLSTSVRPSDRPVYFFCELVRRLGFSRGYQQQSKSTALRS
jgi:glycosyltransferase involved in cell wall biosynthesis